MLYTDSSPRWRGMSELPEGSNSSDVEAGYISSDESGHGGDLAERLRTRPARDIWQLDEIQASLRQLYRADEVEAQIDIGLYDQTLALSLNPLAARTAVLWACWLGRSLLLTKLLRTGASAAAADDAGRTCLHLSCLVGSEDCAKLLLAHGADPNGWDSEINATALHCAASAKSLACIKLLLAHGADVNAGVCARSPLYYAVLSDSPECVQELLARGASPDTPQVYTETPLHVAASLGSAACLELLLEAGADVRAALGPGRATALHLAAEDGHAECARLLLEKGANIDCVNSRQQTPMHLAALAQSVEVVELLVAQGGGVGAQDADGRSPLHGAIVKGARSCDVARQLLTAGADPNAADHFGYTPVHIAALNEFSACICLLLDYGADVTLRTNGGVSVLSFIVRRTPDVMPRFLGKLDDAVHTSEHELGDVDCELTLDFRILVPNLARGEAELLLAFIEVGRKDVLKHPLAETFLFLKWRRIRKFFVMSFTYHAVFITLFSIYVLRTFVCEEIVCDVPISLRPVGYTIVVLNLCFLLKEIYQACHSLSAYIKQWENWLQWLIIVGVFLCAIPHGEVKQGGQAKDTSTWQHDVAALTIFFSWLELMMIVGRFPTFGLYVQMFTTVTVNFATFLMAYSCLLIAFGLSFSVLFSNYPAFKFIPTGLVKTVMMMSGELEYEDIFYRNDSNTTSPDIQYPVTAHAMFLIFVLLVTVILTNLLVGLAVSDIQALQESAGLDRLVRQAQLVAHLEGMLFSRLMRCAPQSLIAVLRWGALLTASHYHSALCIRPNDPRENRIPKELIASIYKMVASKKNIRQSVRRSNNYEFRIKECKNDTRLEREGVKRRSNLFDRYSNDSQQVERRKRTSGSTDRGRPKSLNLGFLQDALMADIKNQLVEMNRKITLLTEAIVPKTDAQLNTDPP